MNQTKPTKTQIKTCISACPYSMKGLLMILMMFTLLLSSCEKAQKKREIRRIVTEWSGKDMLLPEGVPCCLSGRDTTSAFCERAFHTPFKVLLYVDSTGCTDCRLKLHLWKDLIEEADSLFPGQLSFLFYFQPKASEPKVIHYLLRRNRFDYPVFVDVYDRLDEMNNLSQDLNFQCFLLDRHNRVVLIGDPVLNPQMWVLYKRAIQGTEEVASTPITTVAVKEAVYDFGQIEQSGVYKASFELENTGDKPLIIQQVSASCGCTEVEWEEQPIRPKETTKIKVEFKPEEPGFFCKTVSVYANVGEVFIKLLIKGTVVD